MVGQDKLKHYARSVQKMASLAKDMKQDQLKIDLLLGLPITKLRQCMAAVNDPIAVQSWSRIASSLKEQVTSDMRMKFMMVDEMLRDISDIQEREWEMIRVIINTPGGDDFLKFLDEVKFKGKASRPMPDAEAGTSKIC